MTRNVVSPYLPRYINKRVQVKQVRNLLTVYEHTGSLPVFGGVRVAHLFNLPCMHGVFAFCFVFVLCLVCPILSMFRDCPFLIALSDFSNVSFPASSIQHICSENYVYQNK